MTTSNPTYWLGCGRMQAEYETMKQAVEAGEFEWTQATLKNMHSYYRYFNDGDMPGWARSRWDLRRYDPYSWNHCALNDKGLEELERRTDERLAAEWKRFNRTRKH